MRIAIDASRATVTRRTGTESYSLHIIRGLIAAGGGHHFQLYFRDTPPPDLLPSAANVHIEVIRQPRLWTHLGLGPAIRASRPDVLFVPAHVVPWPDVDGVPAVVTLHDLGYLRYPEAHPPGQRLYLDWSTRHSAQTAARVIAVSQATAGDLAELNHISREKIRVIYSGVDETLKPVDNLPEIVTARERYHIPGPYILHVGTLHARKNLVRLVEAFGEVRDTVGGLRLVLAGRPGWGCRAITRRIEALGLGEQVILPGYVDEDDLPALYSGARLVAYPSLYEGFGFPVLEAMACGAPVVTSTASSLPEVVGAAGLSVGAEDTHALAGAMARILTDETLRDELVRRGFEQARRFSWQVCAEKTLAVLAEAAST